MGRLSKEAVLGEHDETYNALLKAFNRFSGTEQLEFSALLLVILCNHIGDKQVIDEAVAMAERTMNGESSEKISCR